TGPVYAGPPLAVGEHVARFLGSHEARIVARDGRAAALFSTLPLTGLTPAGVAAPIDLRLTSGQDGFAPASSAAAVQLPSAANGELRFVTQGFGLRLADAVRQPAQVSDDRLFYANALGAGADTDMVVRPLQTGAEVSWL